MGRTTTAYVSGYQRDRVHVSRLTRGEVRSLTADFNGAMPAGASIVSATWRCDTPQLVVMADASITGRSSAVKITAQYGCRARVKCVVTLDTGEVLTQLFAILVRSGPWFRDENTSLPVGPYDLTVTA